MGGYTLRRLLYMVPTLLIGTLITFWLGVYGPGDPVQKYLGFRATEQNIRQLRHELGLDRPFMVQYGDYMVKALNGDLGQSLLGNRPAITPLLKRVSLISAQLGLCSFLVVIILGVGLGILAGLTQNSPTDYAIVTTLTTLHAVPVFVLAPVLMVVFTLVLHLIPDPIGWDGLFSPKIILPVASIALPNLVEICRLTRNGILDVLPSDYVRTARAKGLGSLRVMLRHVLPNALTPVLTVSGPLFGNLLLGSLFVEYIFAIPGFGNLGFTSFVSLDYPVIVSQTIISATLAMLLILVVDLLYGVLDPRVRLVVPGVPRR